MIGIETACSPTSEPAPIGNVAANRRMRRSTLVAAPSPEITAPPGGRLTTAGLSGRALIVGQPAPACFSAGTTATPSAPASTRSAASRAGSGAVAIWAGVSAGEPNWSAAAKNDPAGTWT